MLYKYHFFVPTSDTTCNKDYRVFHLESIGRLQGPPPSALVHLLEQAMEQHQVGNEPCEQAGNHGEQNAMIMITDLAAIPWIYHFYSGMFHMFCLLDIIHKNAIHSMFLMILMFMYVCIEVPPDVVGSPTRCCWKSHQMLLAKHGQAVLKICIVKIQGVKVSSWWLNDTSNKSYHFIHAHSSFSDSIKTLRWLMSYNSRRSYSILELDS